MTSEGSREIEAARKRLAAAKTQSSIASTNKTSAKSILEIAKKNMKNVELQLQSADIEVQVAQKMLADAEKRWEVIDIDQQEPGPTVINEGSKKRRKVSLSPPHQAIKNTSAADTSHTNYTAAVTNNSARRASTGASAKGQNVTPSAIVKFQEALINYRDDVCRLLKASADKGESTIPPSIMKETRNKIFSTIINLGMPKSVLLTRIGEAEQEAIRLYIQQVHAIKANRNS